jgi:hypothetical protein
MRHFLGHFVVLSQALADHRLHDPIEAGGLAGSIYHGTAMRHVRYPTLALVRQIGEPQLVPLQNIVIRDKSRARAASPNQLRYAPSFQIKRSDRGVRALGGSGTRTADPLQSSHTAQIP